MAVVAEKIIRIDVVASANAQRAINAMATDLKKVETAATGMQRTLSTGFGGLNSMLGKTASFLGAFGVTVGMGALTRWVIESANAYQVLEARLSLVLGSYEKAERATREIADIAMTTGREIDGVAKLYEKASRSAQQFGISQDKVREITLGFSQSIRLSGASTQEAYASLVQFGQALASGRLQGDEFRSLMENNAVFMYEFAKAAGISVAQLRKLGTEGKLSAKFLFDTMSKEGADGLNMMQRLNEMAAKVPLTFGQSINSLGTALLEFTGEMAKIASVLSNDKQGVFGPLIRSISELTDKMRDLREESKLLDGESAWRKFFRLGSGMVEGVLSFGADPPKEKQRTLTEKLQQQTDYALRNYQEAAAKAAAAEKAYGSNFGLADTAGNSLAAQSLTNLNKLRGEAVALEERWLDLKAKQRAMSYGEGFYGDASKDKPKPEPDAAAERKLKSARESLEDFAQARKRDADATWDILLGKEEEKKASRELRDLENQLTEALVKGNSAQAERIRIDIRRAELGRKLLDELKDEATAREKLRGEEGTELERLNTQILRDTEALDALKNKTKATDEYTDAKIRLKLAEAEDERFALAAQELPDAARLAYLNGYIEKLKEAGRAKADLMEGREVDKQNKAQGIVDASNVKRVDDLAEDINRRLKAGVISSDGKSVGEALRENIIEVVGNMTVDIVLNPITSVFSRVLAELADQFSLMLTKSIYEQIASSSSDPIGSLIGLIMSGAGGGSGLEGSSAISGPGMKIPDTLLGPKLATGAAYIPYDNFPARLHRGERVLTAQQNSEYTRGGVTIVSNPSISIDARTDQAVVYGIVTEAVQQGNRALVEEMRAQGVIG